jgi:hypothetical protein
MPVAAANASVEHHSHLKPGARKDPNRATVRRPGPPAHGAHVLIG